VSRITIALADDHPIVLRGLVDLFHDEEDITVVAKCRSGDEILEAIATHGPDVAVVDLAMPGVDGLGVLRSLKGGAARTILLTAHASDDQELEAVRLGARGIVYKDQAAGDLVAAVRHVMAGERWLPRQLIDRALDGALKREAGQRGLPEPLTAREVSVVRWVAKGLSNKGVALKLGITEGTVKLHVHSAFRKLGVRSRVQLAIMAREKGLA
jgi:DNA-binding NarL/FixJ family response regulator